MSNLRTFHKQEWAKSRRCGRDSSQQKKRASFRGKEESTVRDAKQVPFLFIDFLEQMFHEAYFNLSNEKFALQSKGFTIWI